MEWPPAIKHLLRSWLHCFLENKYASKIIYHLIYKYSQLQRRFIDSYKKETGNYTEFFDFSCRVVLQLSASSVRNPRVRNDVGRISTLNNTAPIQNALINLNFSQLTYPQFSRLLINSWHDLFIGKSRKVEISINYYFWFKNLTQLCNARTEAIIYWHYVMIRRNAI